MVDLEGAGCKVVRTLDNSDITGLTYYVVYSEFWKVAAYQKIVFLTLEEDSGFLLTAFEGINVIWRPEFESHVEGEDEGDEALTFQETVCVKTEDGWIIEFEMKNTGTTEAVLNRAYVNGVGVHEVKYSREGFVVGHVSTSLVYSGTEVSIGESVTVHMWVSASYGGFTSGTTVNIGLDSCAGEYGKPVKLV